MSPVTRPRNAAATRAALLVAARELFATDGYERTTVRAVADRAGVNQALLFRYFGNKEGLFAEAATEMALAPLRSGPPDTLLERVVHDSFADEPGSALLLAVLSAGGGAAEELRRRLGEEYRERFADLAATDDREDALRRADLLLAWLLGIGQYRPRGDRAPAEAHVLRAARALLGG
nr:TetR family transcriptional regulator [uncultured bacterium]